MKPLITLLFVTILASCSKPGTATHTIQVKLISPVDQGTLKAGETAEFRWSSSASDTSANVYHGITIKEILLNQSPEVAMSGNKPHFEKDSLKELSFLIVPLAGTPGFVLGKKYAWQVTGKQNSLLVNSSISSFTIVP